MKKDNVNTKEQLYTFLLEQNSSNSYFKESFFKKQFPVFYNEVIKYHNSHYDIDFKFSQKLYNYIFNIDVLPKCKTCNCEIHSMTFSKGYGKYCSYECSWKSDERSKSISNSHKNRKKEEQELSNKKREQTCLQKYGVSHVAKNIDIKRKIKNTLDNKTDAAKQKTKDKYKVTWQNKTEKEKDEIIRKRNETNANKTPEEKLKSYKKSIETRIKHYGSLEESYKSAIEKNKKTCLEKYGVENPFQLDEVIEKTKKRWNEYREQHFDDVIEYINETETYLCKCVDKDCNLCEEKQFHITIRNYLNRKNYNYAPEDICTIKNPIGEFKNKSKLQNDIYDYVKTIYIGIIVYNDTITLKNENHKATELDLYFPDIKIAFEINGDFWHMNPKFYNADDINPKTGELAKNVWNLDLVKKQLCEKNGIKLYTIWENDWKTNQEQEKQRIKDILNLL